MFRVEITKKLSMLQLHQISSLRLKTWMKTGYKFNTPLKSGHIMCRDDLDSVAETDHILVWLEDKLVGAGRVTYHDSVEDIKDTKYYSKAKADNTVFAQLGRLVVDPEYWGQGISKIIDKIRVRIANENNADILLVCAVGDKRCAALVKQGFGVISFFTDDDDIYGNDKLNFYGLQKSADKKAAANSKSRSNDHADMINF